MNYGLNLKTVYKAQIPAPPGLAAYNCADAKTYITAAPPNGLGMTFKPCPAANAPAPTCGPDSCIVAFFIAPPVAGLPKGDFHWVRRNGDGSWTQKHGGQPAIKKDDAGNNMTDAVNPPHAATLKVLTSTYACCGYFCFKKNPPPTLTLGTGAWAVGAPGLSKVSRIGASGIDNEQLCSISTSSQFLSKFPSLSPIPDPMWVTDGNFTGYELLLDNNMTSMPPYVVVHNGVIAYYSDLDGTNITYYADNNGLETYLQTYCASAAVPTLSEWGLLILLLFSLAMGMVFISKRQYALAYGSFESNVSFLNPSL
jgi:hypothetical protein